MGPFSSLIAGGGCTGVALVGFSGMRLCRKNGTSVNDKNSKPEEHCWTTFFASGCRTARDMQEETTRIRCLRDEALESAGLAANPPQSAVFDRPDEGIGYRIGKVQKRAFDEIKGLRAKGLERRADNPPLQTSGAWPRCFRPTIVLQTRSARGALAIDAILDR